MQRGGLDIARTSSPLYHFIWLEWSSLRPASKHQQLLCDQILSIVWCLCDRCTLLAFSLAVHAYNSFALPLPSLCSPFFRKVFVSLLSSSPVALILPSLDLLSAPRDWLRHDLHLMDRWSMHGFCSTLIAEFYHYYSFKSSSFQLTLFLFWTYSKRHKTCGKFECGGGMPVRYIDRLTKLLLLIEEQRTKVCSNAW